MVIVYTIFKPILRKKKSPINWGDDKTGTYVYQRVYPDICTKFDDFDLKNKPRNARPTGSLNGSLCAYVMRQNLHYGTRPRS